MEPDGLEVVARSVRGTACIGVGVGVVAPLEPLLAQPFSEDASESSTDGTSGARRGVGWTDGTSLCPLTGHPNAL
jgi:hypothetical protein